MRLAGWLGLASVLVYVGTVMAGAWATPGYSHLAQPISALFAAEAPAAGPVAMAFMAYNILSLLFALGLMAGHRLPDLRASMFVVALVSLAGLVMNWFPMDAAGAPMSLTGVGHIVLASAQSLGSMLAMGLAARAYGMAAQRGMARTLWALLAGVFVTGILAAVLTGQAHPLAGLMERLTIGQYLLFVLFIAARTIARPSPDGPRI